MNPPVPAFRISSSTSSSSPSSGTSTPREQHGNHVNRASSPASESSNSATPRPSVVDADRREAPPRASSSLSTSSLSSQSSQQTIRASQLPQHALTKHASGAGPTTLPVRLRSRSPRHRAPSPKGNAAPLSSDANGVATTITSTETRARSITGSSSRTALPSIRPPITPTDAIGSSSGRGLATRPGVLDVLRGWFRSYTVGVNESRAGRVIVPTVVVFIAVVLPLIAFIARLRMKRRSAPPSGPTRLIAHSTKPATGPGAVRWLYEAVRDGVIMAGNGLV